MTSGTESETASKIRSHLVALAASSDRTASESQILRAGAFPLLLSLGYSPDEIFFDYSIPWNGEFYRVDAVVAPNRHSSPWLLVEVALNPGVEGSARRFSILSGLCRASGARAAILLTEDVISIASASSDRSPESHCRLHAVTLDQAELLAEQIGRATLTRRSGSRSTPIFRALSHSPSGRFTVDQGRLEQHLARASDAKTPTDKGKEFENLAVFILSGLTDVEIRKKNVLTTTGEIDIVGRFKNDSVPEFMPLNADQYFIVECKNWKKPVGSKEIEVFSGKMLKCRTNLGLLFSREGITGRKGLDAVGNVEALWRQYGLVILVVTEETIRQVIQGFDFYSILERLYEEVRFSER